jgi:hypothetical protein
MRCLWCLVPRKASTFWANKDHSYNSDHKQYNSLLSLIWDLENGEGYMTQIEDSREIREENTE